MINFNYQKICADILKDLPPRTKEVVLRRFALAGAKSKNRETLDSIGKSFNITRERVRQIEQNGFARMKPKAKNYENVFQYFIKEIKNNGGLKKENILLDSLSNKKSQNPVFFLLCLGNHFKKFHETKEFYPFWAIDSNSAQSAQKIINSFYSEFKRKKQPMSFAQLCSSSRKPSSAVSSCLEVSKTIHQGPNNLFGLKEWPEVNPRGVKDWACLVLKKKKKPLHFTDVADSINKIYEPKRKCLPQTIHNELIKDPQFVLVGRGLYALKEWGYETGVVKDVISKILAKSEKPLTKKEIINKMLKQRFIKQGTILLNLNDTERFVKDERERYTIKTI